MDLRDQLAAVVRHLSDPGPRCQRGERGDRLADRARQRCGLRLCPRDDGRGRARHPVRGQLERGLCRGDAPRRGARFLAVPAGGRSGEQLHRRRAARPRRAARRGRDRREPRMRHAPGPPGAGGRSRALRRDGREPHRQARHRSDLARDRARNTICRRCSIALCGRPAASSRRPTSPGRGGCGAPTRCAVSRGPTMRSAGTWWRDERRRSR